MRKRKVIKRIAYVVLLGAILGVQVIPVMADSTILNISQKIDKLSQMVQEQEYTVSYVSDGHTSYAGGTRMEVAFGNGLSADTITVGDWSDYNGSLTVSIYGEDKNTPIYQDTVAENSEIDLSTYTDTEKIQIQADDPVSESTNVSEVKVSGKIDAKVSGSSLKVNVEYLGSEDGKDFQTITTQSISTDCSVYEIEKPVLTLSTNALNQLDPIAAILSGISGEGNEYVSSFTIDMSIPTRMITDRITLPEFGDATVYLFIDGSERKINSDGTYNVGSKVQNIQIAVTVNNEISQIKQTKDMVIEMRNVSSSAGNESLKASIKVMLANAAKVSSESNIASFCCTETNIVDPTPEEPTTPTNPTVPEIPTTPTNPDVVDPTPEESTTPSQSSTPSVNTGNKYSGTNTTNETNETNKIVDLSGTNLQSAKVNGVSSIVAAIVRTDSYKTNKLQSATSERVQTTRVFDFSSDDSSGTTTDDSVSVGSTEESESLPADSIKKTPAEDTTSKIKEAASQSRLLPIILAIIALILIACVVIYYMLRDKKTSEDTQNNIFDENEFDEDNFDEDEFDDLDSN